MPWSRGKKVVVALLSLLALGAAGYGLRVFVPRWLAGRDVKREGASLHRCLFGEPPKPGETPAKRLRRGFLTAAGLSNLEKPTTTGNGWPGRCVRYAEAIGEALTREGEPSFAPPADFAQRVLDIGSGKTDEKTLPLDMFWALAGAGVGPEEVPLPPAPASPLDLNAPNINERIAFVDLSTDPVPTHELRVAFRGERGGLPLVCSFAKALSEVSCLPLAPAARSSHPVLWPAADDGAPALLTDRSGSRSTFFRADTGQAFGNEYEVVGGFAAPPAFVNLVEMELGPNGKEGGLFLQRNDDTKRTDRVPIKPAPGVPFARVRVLADKLVWIETRAGKPHLLVRSLGQSKGPPGPIEDAGVLPYEAMAISACHTQTGLALVAQAKGVFFATLREAEGASALVHAEEPARDPNAIVEMETIGCEDQAVSSTVVLYEKQADRYEVRRVRCAKDACEVTAVGLGDLVSGRDPAARPAPKTNDESAVVAASIGRDQLIVWRTEDAGIRARLGAPSALVRAPDIVVYDDTSDDVNGAGRVYAMRLFGRKDAALLLLHTSSGVKAVRIDGRGVVSAVRPLL